jgi:hypothetical protein
MMLVRVFCRERGCLYGPERSSTYVMLVTAVCNQSKSVDCVKDATLMTNDVTAVVILSSISGSRSALLLLLGRFVRLFAL